MLERPHDIVINTTPLIAIAVATGSLEVLRFLYRNVIVPAEVEREILAAGPAAPGVAEFNRSSWLQRRREPQCIATFLLLLCYFALRRQDDTPGRAIARPDKRPWPKTMRDQIAAVRAALADEALTLDALAAGFKEPKKTAPLIADALAALAELGLVQREGERYRMMGGRTGG